MADNADWIHFRFESDGFEPGTFDVLDFEGFERISAPYEFTINLSSSDLEVDLAALSQEAARLVFRHGEEEHKIHGVLAECRETGRGEEVAYYRVVLVPRLWLLSLQRQNQVHMSQKIDQTLQEELEQSGLVKGEDFEIRLTRTDYPECEYVVQFEESDLNFVRRQMEHYGIFFFFEQGEEKEKLVIADNNSAFPQVEGDPNVLYRPQRGTSEGAEAVYAFVGTQNRMPQKVILSDYNYRTPSVELRAEHTVSSRGHGIVSTYGDHFKTPEEGQALAEVRAQEILSREKVFHGRSSVLRFRAGCVHTLDEHPRSDVSGRSYLFTSVHHQGTQPRMGEGSEGASDSRYENDYECIPSETAYRPPRETPKPKLYGVLNAKVDAASDGQYAEIDDQGRYKVKLPFDLTGRGDGRASRYMRKAEPYAGPGYGQHFPLHKNCEVLLTCVDGDPDRPVIAGSVPNPEQASPVNNTNQATSAIRTGGGNFVELDDTDGSERIKMTSPNSNTYFHLGAANQDAPGACLETDGQVNIRSADLWFTKTDSTREDRTASDYTENHEGDHTYTVGGKQEGNVGSNCTLEVGGNRTVTVDGEHKVNDNGTFFQTSMGAKSLWQLSFENKNTAGAEMVTLGGLKAEELLGGKTSFTQAFRMEHTLGPNLVQAAQRTEEARTVFDLKAGARFEVHDTPVVQLRGTSAVELQVGGTYIKISDGKIHLNASSKVQIDADVHITKTLKVDGGIDEQ